MRYKKFKDKLVVRIDQGEEILEKLELICRKENIQLGQISGIGAVNQATVGLFDPEIQLYHSIELKGDYEVTSLSGNITRQDEKVYLHIHANLSDEDHKTLGGHLNRAVVSATCEIVIDIIQGEVKRKYDDQTGLNLLDL